MRQLVGRSKSLISNSIKYNDFSENDIIMQVFPRFKKLVSTIWLQSIITTTLSLLDKINETRWYIGVTICDDQTIQDLNSRYRGIDEITDVLSFSMIHEGKYYGFNDPIASAQINFPNPTGALEPIGEVIVSFPQAKRQALKANITTEEELTTLLVHGTLHVFGYDHEKDSDHKIMEKKQNLVVGEIKRMDLRLASSTKGLAVPREMIGKS